MERIPRAEALQRVRAERGAEPCLVCALLRGQAGPLHVIARAPGATVVLSRYAQRPGHLLVLADDHATSFEEISEAVWLTMQRLAYRAARLIEREFAPARSYVALLGSDSPDAPMSSTHAHVHVVPVDPKVDRPRTVLTWEHGVFVDTAAGFAALEARLKRAWDAQTS